MGGEISLREYQKNIVNSILRRGNTLVVLPTGTGKTFIAFYILNIKKNGVFLAPTKPLITQHYENFVKLFPEFEEKSALLIGEISKKKRASLLSKDFIFATPQTIEKDISKIIRDVFIFDECHRAVGKYSYSKIAKQLPENVLKIGLTASPGGKKEKIEEVLENLGIENVEIRTGEEEDIKEYIISKKYEWVFVSLTPSLRQVISLVKEEIKKYREWFRKNKINIPKTKSDLIAFRKRINDIPKPLYFSASSYYSVLFNLTYLLEFIETQGYHYFLSYIDKLRERKTKATKTILNSENIRKAIYISQKEVKEGNLHPKFYKLKEILDKHKDTKVIVFFQYISTMNLAKKFLEENGFSLLLLTGKRTGFGKKEQEETIEKFRKNEESILLSTSVGEEGLDIPKVDVVVFFDVVPSEIRSIQRKGRAGRTREGKVYFIITLNTMEVAFYRAAKRKESLMKKKLKEMNKEKEVKTTKETRENIKDNSLSLRKREKGTIFDYL